MKYLYLILIFLLTALVFMFINFYGHGWQFVQPFFIISLLVYFNNQQAWIYYTFAILSGLFVDSFTGVFGLHAFIFILIIFILKSLQLTILTSKNMLTIILLTIFSFIFFWLIFYLSNLIFAWDFYYLSAINLFNLFKMLLVNIFLVTLSHLIYFNLKPKKDNSVRNLQF